MGILDTGLPEVATVRSVAHKLGEPSAYIGNTLVVGITQFKVGLFVYTFVPDIAELTSWIWTIRSRVAVASTRTAQNGRTFSGLTLVVHLARLAVIFRVRRVT